MKIGMPVDTMLAWMSCTATTCGTCSKWERTSSRSRPLGVSSRSTRTALRNSLMARGIIMSAMMPPATASNPAQPVQMSTLADTITATDPKASFMTSRNAAFMFMLSSLCDARIKIDPILAARPSMPMKSSNRTSFTSSADPPKSLMPASTSA